MPDTLDRPISELRTGPGLSRDKRLELALFAHELEYIKARAAETGHRPGSWARHVLLKSHPPKPRAVSREAQEIWLGLARPLGHLAEISANLNRAAAAGSGSDLARAAADQAVSLCALLSNLEHEIRRLRSSIVPTR